MTTTFSAAAADAAASVAAGFGITGTEPVILADGANVIIHLSPSPVVAKVAASTTAVRPDAAAWLAHPTKLAKAHKNQLTRICQDHSPYLGGYFLKISNISHIFMFIFIH